MTSFTKRIRSMCSKATRPVEKRIRFTPSLIRFWMVATLLVCGVPTTVAQEQPVVAPSTERAQVTIQRGRDIVQPPSLWYQEGTKPPDSLGILRIPCCGTGDPDAITYPDAELNFPVNLQVATFVRDGQIAELPLSPDVLQGITPGRIIIRPPVEDFYDIAAPYGVDPLKQVPGDETIIDARAWYRASLRNPATNQEAPEDQFHTIRELRGQLRSTARGGESVYFVIVAGRAARPMVTLTPILRERIVTPELRATIDLRIRLTEIETPRLDWTTTTALLAGPNRADLPGRSGLYRATRVKGDVRSTLRWHANPTESYSFTVFGSSQPTFGDTGNHHDVPYGLGIAARFGSIRALELRAEALYEDDPFQAQTFRTGDQRLRLMMGYDYETAGRHLRVSVGPTYFRDLSSSWEGGRSDARELGFMLEGAWDEQLQIGRFPSTLSSLTALHQSWGYIRDAGNRNTMIEGRLALKPNFRIGSAHMALGPVGYLQYVDNAYATIPGFSEFNAQAGVELSTRILF